MPNCILTLVCRDQIGIVHAVSGFLSERHCNIVDSQQFGDDHTGNFFMRVNFIALDEVTRPDELSAGFAVVAERFGMQWELHDAAQRCRTLVMVSKVGHCLNDLLYRWQIGALHVDMLAVVSNHADVATQAAMYGVPFHHLPVTDATRAAQEAALLELIDQYRIDLVVLARYMQVLSADLCERLPGRIINIHHSFLPSFQGARPYHQAHAHGVKLIGATAHYVTADLDSGPIIEQEVERVDHADSPEHLASVGRDVEAVALARAVQWHAEHRILLNGAKTVVFT